MVSIVVITALRTMANETQTLRAKAAWLDDGSSRSKKSFRLKGFCVQNKREHMDKRKVQVNYLFCQRVTFLVQTHAPNIFFDFSYF